MSLWGLGEIVNQLWKSTNYNRLWEIWNLPKQIWWKMFIFFFPWAYHQHHRYYNHYHKVQQVGNQMKADSLTQTWSTTTRKQNYQPVVWVCLFRDINMRYQGLPIWSKNIHLGMYDFYNICWQKSLFHQGQRQSSLKITWKSQSIGNYHW